MNQKIQLLIMLFYLILVSGALLSSPIQAGEKKTAEWHLHSWIATAPTSGINILEKSAKTLEEHFDGILAAFDFDCLSTGPLEATNNKIKTMQRKAYGFMEMEFFKLKIMAILEKKYALVG